ncbi:TPA: helix-turn-helix transcriptional regulator [Streptococcus suis]
MNRLKELRKEKGLSQVAFSKEIGIPLRTLQSWENGESQIKPDKAQALADHFGVSVGYLLGYSEYSDKFLAFDELRKIDSGDFANGAKAKILSLVSKQDLDSIKKSYVLYDGYEPDYMPYIDFLHAVDILEDTSESDLLIWYALLDESKRQLVLNLARSLAKPDN